MRSRMLTYRKGWHVCFFDSDRNRRQLPRLAFFNSDEAMVEFTRRAGGPQDARGPQHLRDDDPAQLRRDHAGVDRGTIRQAE